MLSKSKYKIWMVATLVTLPALVSILYAIVPAIAISMFPKWFITVCTILTAGSILWVAITLLLDIMEEE